ncbi:DUF6415 family natural product biosynthesis protein [Streptomyces ipomoeae]|uniref:DUF6415 family natural product biosynthesis protein n=1 Tax=Streptomyces ipomoeae TaxID=103232 RepID=UPI0029CA08A9|nr:DUF6415 family natural product biosynthesis protein [Streptomyces ipomoeae]
MALTGQRWEGFLAYTFKCKRCATMPVGQGCVEGDRVRRGLPADAARQVEGAPVESLPVDTETMRATTARLLAEDAELPTTGELDDPALLIPEVERAACTLPNDNRPRARALGRVSEARARLGIKPGRTPAGQMVHAERLARSVICLLGHLEKLGGECS